MALKNFQYKQILQQYDETRFHNRHLEEKRYQEVLAVIPEIEQIDKEISSNGIFYAKMALKNPTLSTNELKQKNKMLAHKKQALLMRYGFPKNYLAPIYQCNDCKDTGFINEQKCHCFKQAIVDLLYKQANLETILKYENFHRFRFDYYDHYPKDPELELTPFENIQRIVRECQQFIRSFEENYENILLCGNTGVGKTFLLNCIAKEILDMTYTVVYLTSFKLFDILAKHIFSKEIEEKNETDYQFQYIFNCDLLIIDDLGTENVNGFIASQLYQCVNERHLNQKSTIISTNLCIEDIRNLYSERVLSRISSNYKFLKIIGNDIRVKRV